MLELISRTIRLAVGAALVGVLAGAGTRHNETPRAVPREAIQTRVTVSFDFTVMFTPAEAGPERSLAERLAPLIIQEVTSTNTESLWRDQFGLPSAPPQVVFESGQTLINGRSHDQLDYSWTYPSNTPTIESVRMAQGVRLTLNAAGEPVIWEVLGDSSGANIIYVAQSLELAARAEFGSPLPGRRFSIERSLAEAPDTIVANVISDGPTPMGPVIYLRTASRDVSALICRCMPSQGGRLLGQKSYELHPAVTQNSFPRVPLDQRLRLPESF